MDNMAKIKKVADMVVFFISFSFSFSFSFVHPILFIILLF